MKDLYYVLMYNGLGNAKECRTLIKHGEITVNGQPVYDVKYKTDDNDIIVFHDRTLNAQPFVYLMMNKPKGYICANHDQKEKCVIDLIDHKECFCLGRLDKNTTGLLILTNDKSLKKLLLPTKHVPKTYDVELKRPLDEKNVISFHKGVIIDRNVRCLPAQLKICDRYHCQVTIEEGKYHQIKKMFLSVGNEVLSLKRVSFGPLFLDESLKNGEVRNLCKQEIQDLLVLLSSQK